MAKLNMRYADGIKETYNAIVDGSTKINILKDIKKKAETDTDKEAIDTRIKALRKEYTDSFKGIEKRYHLHDAYIVAVLNGMNYSATGSVTYGNNKTVATKKCFNAILKAYLNDNNVKGVFKEKAFSAFIQKVFGSRPDFINLELKPVGVNTFYMAMFIGMGKYAEWDIEGNIEK